MSNTIACRVASYGAYQDRAWTHLPEIGIRNVEIPVPPAGELADAKQRLADHGLAATSLQGRCDITAGEAPELMRPQLDACAELGARICFLSVKAGETPRQLVWERLRAIGTDAAERGVIVALETHPDLMVNGDVARETIQSVNHPNIRVNFDTGNIYFYNHDRTADGELAKVIDLVGAVHIKDSSGGFQEWVFPTLGTGVVDFPAVFELLAARGFNGPYTMELEGTKGKERNEAEQLEYIADSVAYLRTIGAFD